VIDRIDGLAFAQLVHAGGDDPVLRIDAVHEYDALLAIGTDRDGLQVHLARLGVEHPDRRLAVLFIQRGQRHEMRRIAFAAAEEHACSLAELGLTGVFAEGHADAVGTRRRIGLRRDLAQNAGQMLAGFRPELDRRGLFLVVTRDAALGHADLDFALAVAGQGGDGLARCDDLAGFGHDARDDAVLVGAQFAVAGLVLRDVQRGARFGGARGRCLQTVVDGIELGFADEILAAQRFVA